MGTRELTERKRQPPTVLVALGMASGGGGGVLLPPRRRNDAITYTDVPPMVSTSLCLLRICFLQIEERPELKRSKLSHVLQLEET